MMAGAWLNGFMCNIGQSQILEAEAWGLYTGLKMVIVVESNYQILVDDLSSYFYAKSIPRSLS